LASDTYACMKNPIKNAPNGAFFLTNGGVDGER